MWSVCSCLKHRHKGKGDFGATGMLVRRRSTQLTLSGTGSFYDSGVLTCNVADKVIVLVLRVQGREARNMARLEGAGGVTVRNVGKHCIMCHNIIV